MCRAEPGRSFLRTLPQRTRRSRPRRQGSPGPAPAGGPLSCTPKKGTKEGRSRGLPPEAACPGLNVLPGLRPKRAFGPTHIRGGLLPQRPPAGCPLRGGFLSGCLRRMPGARYARQGELARRGKRRPPGGRPLAGASRPKSRPTGSWPRNVCCGSCPPRVPGLSPLR